ncbi:hypothetical protein [Endozoicomonas sp. ONNA1]|uniref:hypothetical protein n=1 Tax=Endozoicomonas sp. ONNA1 TaxID=2828740 RepID=UPI0021495EDB|nr:hypothetical protein [Endozoicomonas sp. ONNA1]
MEYQVRLSIVPILAQWDAFISKHNWLYLTRAEVGNIVFNILLGGQDSLEYITSYVSCYSLPELADTNSVGNIYLIFYNDVIELIDLTARHTGVSKFTETTNIVTEINELTPGQFVIYLLELTNRFGTYANDNYT